VFASLRAQVLGKLDTLVKDWVRRVSAAKGFTEPLLSEVRPALAPRRPLPCVNPNAAGAFPWRR